MPGDYYAPRETRSMSKSTKIALPVSLPAQRNCETRSATTPPPNPSQPKSTPMKFKQAGWQPHRVGHTPLGAETYERMAEETDGCYVGPMPVQQFFNRYMSSASIKPLPRDSGHNVDLFPRIYNDTGPTRKEKDMYPLFVKAARQFAPDLNIEAAATTNDRLTGGGTDIQVYAKSIKRERKSTQDFSLIAMPGEIKTEASKDAFQDPNPGYHVFEATAGARMQTRGQIATYAAQIMGSQYRKHMFSFLLCGQYVRFIRWDRASAVVTERIDYTKQPEILAGFIWRFNHLSDRERGSDETVTEPTKDELRQACLHFDDLSLHRKYLKIEIPDGKNASLTHHCIVPAPKPPSISPFGRCTRWGKAYDLRLKQLIFFKDYWRANGAGGETDTYAKLEAAKVPHIAHFRYGYDIPGHITEAIPDLSNESWVWKDKEGRLILEVASLVHHRLGLGWIPRRLSEFKSLQELVGAVADGMEAHDAAVNGVAAILHRDISANNIRITDDGKGVLLDWDLSADVSGAGSPRSKGRTGTWQFISIALLRDPKRLHVTEDDQESAFWVLTWIILCYLDHHCPPDKLGEILSAFDESQGVSDEVVGGTGKLALLSHYKRMIIVPLGLEAQWPQLSRLLLDIASTLLVRYQESPTAEDDEFLDELLREKSDVAGKDPKQEKMLEKIIERLPASQYRRQIEMLRSKGWLTGVLRRYLEDEEWRTDDGAVVNQVRAPKQRSKRPREEIHLLPDATQSSKRSKISTAASSHPSRRSSRQSSRR